MCILKQTATFIDITAGESHVSHNKLYDSITFLLVRKANT